MPQDANHLIWIDMEMTGLKPEIDRIIEIALVVTDSNLATVAEAPVLVVHQDSPRSPEWIPGIRAPTLVQASSTIEGVNARRGGGAGAHARVSARARPSKNLADVRQYDLPGPTVSRALDADAGGLFSLSQPRRLDAEGVVQKRWQPDIAKSWVKLSKHEALADVYESIEELKYYRGTFIRS
jgi:oligoribonuclease